MSKLTKVRLQLTAFEDRLVPASFGTISPDSISVSPDNGGVPRVKIVNPATGEDTGEVQAFEDSFRGGVRSALGDVNGDGVRDIAIVPGPGGAPRLRVVDGASGATLIDLNVYEPTFRGGLYVALGDVNGDGKADVITGTGDGGAPRVRVLDGATLGQTVLRDYFAYETSFRGGVLVAAGDVDGDHKADVITGTGVGGGPRVVSFAGSDNRVLQNFFAYEDTFRGGVQVSAGDVDGDGRDDIITGTGPGGGPVVRVVGGSNNQTLLQFLADDSSFRGGVSVDSSDINGDGRKEVITHTRHGGSLSVKAFDRSGGAGVRSFSRDVEDATPSSMTTVSPPVTPPVSPPVTVVSPTAHAVDDSAASTTVPPAVSPPVSTVSPIPGPTDDSAAHATDGSSGGSTTVSGSGSGSNSGQGSGKNTSLVASKVEGAVTAVDATASTLTAMPQSGAAVVVKVGPTTKVERNGKHATLSAFKVGDAVEAKLGSDGVALEVEATGV